MVTFDNVTTKETYEKAKKNIMFEYVPNTAVGYEHTRAYIVSNGFRYLVSANTEKDYILRLDDGNNHLFIRFRLEGDKVTIYGAINGRRNEQADKYLNKYKQLLAMICSCIKYDKIVCW